MFLSPCTYGSLAWRAYVHGFMCGLLLQGASVREAKLKLHGEYSFVV